MEPANTILKVMYQDGTQTYFCLLSLLLTAANQTQQPAERNIHNLLNWGDVYGYANADGEAVSESFPGILHLSMHPFASLPVYVDH